MKYQLESQSVFKELMKFNLPLSFHSLVTKSNYKQMLLTIYNSEDDDCGLVDLNVSILCMDIDGQTLLLEVDKQGRDEHTDVYISNIHNIDAYVFTNIGYIKDKDDVTCITEYHIHLDPTIECKEWYILRCLN